VIVSGRKDGSGFIGAVPRGDEDIEPALHIR